MDWDTESCEPEYTPNDDPTEIKVSEEYNATTTVREILDELIRDKTDLAFDPSYSPPRVYLHEYSDWTPICSYVSDLLEYKSGLEISPRALEKSHWFQSLVLTHLIYPYANKINQVIGAYLEETGEDA